MRRRILIVDDSQPEMADRLRRELESRGSYDVREEHDPAHAASAARAFDPDVLLIELQHPYAGWAARLREDPELRKIPAAVVVPETNDLGDLSRWIEAVVPEPDQSLPL